MLSRKFIEANQTRINAEDGRADLIDSIADVIGYKGPRRRSFMLGLRGVPYIKLLETVLRYYQKGKLSALPCGYVLETCERVETAAQERACVRESTIPDDDIRNFAARMRASFNAAGNLETAEVITPALDTFARQAADCKTANGCAGCRRLSRLGFCRKWNRYITATETAAAW